MKRLWILLLLTLATSNCADPTRVITNKPKSDAQKQQEREQRRRDDKAATEALRNFRTTDQARKKTKEANQRKTDQETSKERSDQPGRRRQTISPSAPEILLKRKVRKDYFHEKTHRLDTDRRPDLAVASEAFRPAFPSHNRLRSFGRMHRSEP